MRHLATGKRGVVYLTERDGRTVVAKKPNPDADVNTIGHEAEILQRVNEHGIGPGFIALEDGMLVREFVDGPEILDWAEDASRDGVKAVLLDLLDQCRKLDTLGLSKRELTRPYRHVLIRDGKPVQIDFERARETDRPQNVTQLCQWFTNSRMTSLLEEKGIAIDRADLRRLAKAYKDSYDDTAYGRLVRLVEEA